METSFNWFDYTILGILIFSTIISFFRGFLREAISLAAWILGLFLALRYATQVQIYLLSWINSEPVRYFVAFVGIFLITVLVGALINFLVSLLLHKTGMSFTDRFIGLFFGAARGIAIVLILLLILTHFNFLFSSSPLTHSKMAHYFKPGVQWLNSFLPNKWKSATEWLQQDFKNSRNAYYN